MKSSTTNPFAKPRIRRVLWFIGFYVASIVIIGAFYMLMHFILHIIA